LECERLGTLLKAKKLGFTLAEIRQMIVDAHDDPGALSISRRQCFDQIKCISRDSI
jgi:DNA-binding transcriptional MerR regulator